MIKTKMTIHAKTDRLDRLAACVRYLGVGEVILETIHNNVRFRLTSTGICLLYALDEETLITGYMCPVKKCAAMYASCGYEKMPPAIYKTVTRNNKKYSFLLDMQGAHCALLLVQTYNV